MTSLRREVCSAFASIDSAGFLNRLLSAQGIYITHLPSYYIFNYASVTIPEDFFFILKYGQ